MPSLPHAATAATLLCVAVAGLPALAPTYARRAGLDYWNTIALRRELAESADENRRLEATLANVRVVQAVKSRLIADLIGGRTTLPAVTDEFFALAAADPDYLYVVRYDYPGVSDREAVARNVVACAYTTLGDPAAEPELRRRLDAGLRHILGDPGDADAVARR